MNDRPTGQTSALTAIGGWAAPGLPKNPPNASRRLLHEAATAGIEMKAVSLNRADNPLLDVLGVHLLPAGLSGLAEQVGGANQRTAEV